MGKTEGRKWRRRLLGGCVCAVAGGLIVVGGNYVWVRSSKDSSCMVCHVHPASEESWRQSTHYNNPSGTKTSCVECHLPPSGSLAYVGAKVKTGGKDILSFLFKKRDRIDWDAKGEPEYARRIVYNASCVECHHQLFPQGISDDGVTAHLYYEENHSKLDMNCIDCHLDVGHYNPSYSHSRMSRVPRQELSGEVFTAATPLSGFADFLERIPGTAVSFAMRAIPAGSFTMGSPDDEPFHEANESPQREVTVERFFMAETETTWAMYWAFLAATMSEGRIPPEETYSRNAAPDLGVDAISGPTPPFGNPEQGWGGGERAAITMTHYGAEIFCRWLSAATGKTYRLPTEAEWEYAVRAGTETPYFFEGSPRKYSSRGLWRKIFRADTTVINSYATYALNSRGRTGEPARVKPNQWGLRNMSGNVWEYTSDSYSGERRADGTSEWVIRGGSCTDDAAAIRSAVRTPTQHDRWLRTDPQQPKSIWWYSDMKAIGFRVVCEADARMAQDGKD